MIQITQRDGLLKRRFLWARLFWGKMAPLTIICPGNLTKPQCYFCYAEFRYQAWHFKNMAPNILLFLPLRGGLSPFPWNLGGFVSASTNGGLSRLGYKGHALHLVLVQHFFSGHSLWVILLGTQTCYENPMPTEWPCEDDVDNSPS